MITAFFIVVGALMTFGFVTLLTVSRGAIHEVGAIVLLLCALLSIAVACISYQLARIQRELQVLNLRAPQHSDKTEQAGGL